MYGVLIWTSFFVAGGFADIVCPPTYPYLYTLVYKDTAARAMSNIDVRIDRQLTSTADNPSTTNGWPAFQGSSTYLTLVGEDSHVIALKSGANFVPKQVVASVAAVQNVYIEAYAGNLKAATYTTKVNSAGNSLNTVRTTDWATNITPARLMMIHYRNTKPNQSVTVQNLSVTLCLSTQGT